MNHQDLAMFRERPVEVLEVFVCGEGYCSDAGCVLLSCISPDIPTLVNPEFSWVLSGNLREWWKPHCERSRYSRYRRPAQYSRLPS